MADPAPTTGDTPARRDRRRDRKRRQVRRIAGIVGAVLVVAAVALLAVDVVRLGGGDKPSLAGTVHVSGNDDESARGDDHHRRPQLPSALHHRPAAALGRRRLAGGIARTRARQARRRDRRGAALLRLAGCRAACRAPASSTGPSTPTTEMAAPDPEVVVFIIGTNDWTAVSGDWKDAVHARRSTR